MLPSFPKAVGRWLLALGLPLAAAAQTVGPGKPLPLPVQFGKPDPADFEAKNFVADSAAPAVVLCDFGNTRFGSVAGEMSLLSDRITRIKILKTAGYDYATVEVPLHHNDKSAEKLDNLRGFTYLPGPDGKLLKTKLDAGKAVEEKRTAHLKILRFTLPNVQAGAVIEYSYTTTSTFFTNYQDWTFQGELPTRWSEYRSSIPLVYEYKILYQGYLPLAVNQVSAGTTNMLLTNRISEGAGVMAGAEAGMNSLSMNTEQHRWVMEKVPAFRREPYMTASRDYLSRLTFELAGIQMPNEKHRDLTDTWVKKNKTLLDNEFFGGALKHANFLADAVQPLLAQYPDPLARATAVRELVLKSVKHDGTNDYYASGPLRRSYELHRGNSADVNLLLLAALRQAGLSAQPVLLSTRAHGRVSQEWPLLEQFNYVVALVELPGGSELLLDATSPLLPAGVLPPLCLNKLGHTVPDAGEGRWVSLVPRQRYNHLQQVRLALDTQGNLSGAVDEEFNGYAALEAYEKLLELGEKKYVGALTTAHPGWEVPTYTFGQRVASQPVKLHYELRQPVSNPSEGTELYVKPLAAFGEQRNPFLAAQRRYPVDMGMMQQEVVVITLTLPPGYVAELPRSALLALPDKGGRYMYSASSPTPGTVQLTSRLTLDKPVYGSDDYDALRELYRQMLVKQAEALVIKKG